MAAPKHFSLVVFALVSLLSIAALSAKSTHRGVTLELIHRESPKSPLHNPEDSRYTQVRNAVSRSIARAKWLSARKSGFVSLESDPETELKSGNGEYLINYSLGTPAFPILSIADTGSDLIWIQCKPCKECYNQTTPLFDTTKTSTYRALSCSAPQCGSGSSGFNPSCSNNKCQYSVSYGDGSTSSGAVASETLTLGTFKFPKTTFGCGFNNQGTFSSSGSGIVGLGNGPTSLIGQLGKSIGGKFSYCLVSIGSSQSSTIHFGESSVFSGEDVVSTPLIPGDQETFYNLNLEAITVGSERVPYTSESSFVKASGSSNIIIDSGTTLLILTQEFYDAVTSEIQKQVTGSTVDDPTGGSLLCYSSDGFESPKFTANFEGADLKLNDFNVWLQAAEDVVCFAAAPSTDLSIYGNLAQMNFLVGYDKAGQTVSFKPTDCTKQN